MFDKPYEFRYKNFARCGPQEPFLRVHTYKFMVAGAPYIMRAEEYDWKLFAVKFYPKSFEDSPNRYNKLTNAGHASRIFSTCMRIMLDLYSREPKASIGFIGVTTESESQKSRTKRFRLYARLMEEFFSPLTFSHKRYARYSAYLLLNQRYEREIPDLLTQIEEYLFELLDFGEKPDAPDSDSNLKQL